MVDSIAEAQVADGRLDVWAGAVRIGDVSRREYDEMMRLKFHEVPTVWFDQIFYWFGVVFRAVVLIACRTMLAMLFICVGTIVWMAYANPDSFLQEFSLSGPVLAVSIRMISALTLVFSTLRTLLQGSVINTPSPFEKMRYAVLAGKFHVADTTTISVRPMGKSWAFDRWRH